MKKTKSLVILLTVSFMLTACSGGDVLIFDTRLGPVTKEQIKSLPDGLIGDKDNTRTASYALEGEGMTDDEGN